MAINLSIGSCRPSVWPRLPVASSACHSGVVQLVAAAPPALRLNTGRQCRPRGSQALCGPPLVCMASDSSLNSTCSTRRIAGRVSGVQAATAVRLHGLAINRVLVFSERQGASCNFSWAERLGKT